MVIRSSRLRRMICSADTLLSSSHNTNQTRWISTATDTGDNLNKSLSLKLINCSKYTGLGISFSI